MPHRCLIRTRDDLIDYVKMRSLACGRLHIARAIDEGSVEVLGGFKEIPPSYQEKYPFIARPGWIVRVNSVRGTQWHVAVTVKEGSRDMYAFVMVHSVPWKHWVGGSTPLYKGDYPDRYETLRSAACGRGVREGEPDENEGDKHGGRRQTSGSRSDDGSGR